MSQYPLIDIVIPVYTGITETRQCLDSVLSGDLSLCDKIIVINDASPDPDIVDYCKSLPDEIVVIHNETNLGFVGSVNKGMQLSEVNDVILLNSDTVVSRGWIEKLSRAAYSEDAVGTVTPLSNNAEIASYPVFCADNTMLPGITVERMNCLAEQANESIYVSTPTGVGFCFYVKRLCLKEVGYFDESVFGKGYGEENDFCLRASSKGWKHLIAADTFVFHKGSVSFGADKSINVEKAIKAINKIYPDYQKLIEEYIRLDPLRTARENLDRAILLSGYDQAIDELQRRRLSQRNDIEKNNVDKNIMVSSRFSQDIEAFAKSDKPRLLFVTHNWGGGVEQYVQSLQELLKNEYDVVILRGLGKGGVAIDLPNNKNFERKIYNVGGFSSESLGAWLKFLASLSFSRVHLHHIQGWPYEILSLIKELNVPVDITAHDFYLISPYYHLQSQGVHNEESSWPASGNKWLEAFSPFLARAERVIAPSNLVAERLLNAVSDAPVVVMPHPQQVNRPLAIKKIVLLGALSPEKGLDIAEKVALLVAEYSLNIAITLIGYASRPLKAPIYVTGSYSAQELPRLMAQEKPDLIWFPAQVPETYSYTLTQAMACDIPVVASSIGAFTERLSEYDKGYLLPADTSAEDWVEKMSSVLGAVGNQKASVFYDNLSEYKEFYTGPINLVRPQELDESAMQEFLPALTPPPAIEDTPIKYLFDFGVYCRHWGKIEEVRRRLSLLNDKETEVVGAREVEKRHADYLSVMDDLKVSRYNLELSHKAIADLSEELRASVESEKALANNFAEAARNIEVLQRQAENARRHIAHLEETNAGYAEKLDAIINSHSWRMTRPLRVLRRLIKAAPRLSARIFSHALRPASYRRLYRMILQGRTKDLYRRLVYEVRTTVGQSEALDHQSLAATEQLQDDNIIELENLTFYTDAHPKVSIVIPVFGQHLVTYRCLRSICKHPPRFPYEVIIADDCSPEPAEEALAVIKGVTFCRNIENLGFVGNMNFGASRARGEYLILLNNDTLVRAGAFDALIDTFNQHSNVGLVGAKLLNADGSLQEAGGIIWKDGSGWNWGRHADPHDPLYNYVREVDYCSGAALAVKRNLFEALSGFDLYYRPAYYEDTDLAFRIRQKNLRVLYQPAAEIYHLEGVTHGKDETAGVKAYQSINAKKFFDRWQSVLSTHAANGVSAIREANRYSKGTILIIEACMITPDQDSGSVRMLNLLMLLKQQNYHVIFIADNLEYRKKQVDQLFSMGVEVLFDHWAGSVKKVIKNLGTMLDAVMISRHYIACEYVAVVRQYAPQALLIFDTVDLHFIREEREAEVANSASLKAQAAATRKQELALINTCDITVVVSEYEKRLLGELTPAAMVDIISNIHSQEPQRPAFHERQGIIFVGGFRHTPNVDAIQWYVKQVVPHIQVMLPGVETIVIGSNMPANVKALESDSVKMLGYVEDIEPFLQRARVSVAPLRYGAGVKGKINEAMNFGIPVVATACAVEGMYLSVGNDVLVADDPKEFASEIARVYMDENLWEKLSHAGVNNIESHFSPKSALPAINRIFSGNPKR